MKSNKEGVVKEEKNKLKANKPVVFPKKKSIYIPLVHVLHSKNEKPSNVCKSNVKVNSSNSFINSSMNQSFIKQKVDPDDKMNQNGQKYKQMIDDLEEHLKFLNKKLLNEKLTNSKLNSIKNSFIQKR